MGCNPQAGIGTVDIPSGIMSHLERSIDVFEVGNAVPEHMTQNDSCSIIHRSILRDGLTSGIPVRAEWSSGMMPLRTSSEREHDGASSWNCTDMDEHVRQGRPLLLGSHTNKSLRLRGFLI